MRIEYSPGTEDALNDASTESSEAPRTDRRAITSWCLYDFANSSFATLIVTFVYSVYFSKTLGGDAAWSRGVTVTAVAVAALSPFLGAIADRGGFRKRLLLAATLVAIGGTAALTFLGPGHATAAIVVFVTANIAFEVGLVFYNAFLPDLAPRNVIGRVSGIGWGVGYVGGILALLAALFLFIQPETPAFGVLKDGDQNVRATCMLVAVWFAVFSIPMFLWVKDDKSTAGTDGKSTWAAGWTQLVVTLKEIREYKQIVRFLIARLIYNDGLVTIFAFGGIYAEKTFQFDVDKLIYFGLLLNVTAGIGAFAFGLLDDKLGGRKTILISLAALVITTAATLSTRSESVFWVSAAFLGIFIGPNQSASRSLMGRFVPDDKESEFFGFFAFSGKATAFLGPFFYGLIRELGYSPSWALSVTIAFYLIGGAILFSVDEEAGIRAADRNAR